MELLLITNRKRNTNTKKKERYYGEELRHEGAHTSIMARLDRQGGDYFVEEISDTRTDVLFKENRISTLMNFLNLCVADEYDCVFYVHGYGKIFEQSIEQAIEIRNRYSNTAVITFSWPSREKDGMLNFRTKYENVQEVARTSANALKEVLEELKEALQRLPQNNKPSVNLLIHSMGNYLFEQIIRSNPEIDLSMFDHIIHNQADVPISTHKEWIQHVKPARQVYITSNKGDVVLMASQILNDGPEDDRLGDSIHEHPSVRSNNAIYIDFSKTSGLSGGEHQLFGPSGAEKNLYVKGFFERAFSGKKAVKGEAFVWFENLKCYRLIK